MALGPLLGGEAAAAVGVPAVFVGIGLLWACCAAIVRLGVRETGAATASR